MKRLVLAISFGLVSSFLVIPGEPGSGVARATTVVTCDIQACAAQGNGAYVSCINDRHPRMDGIYDSETGIRDCPAEGEMAQTVCLYTSGCFS